jgi:hypothetical protein
VGGGLSLHVHAERHGLPREILQHKLIAISSAVQDDLVVVQPFQILTGIRVDDSDRDLTPETPEWTDRVDLMNLVIAFEAP